MKGRVADLLLDHLARPDVDLGRAAGSLALIAEPALDLDAVARALDRYAETVSRYLPAAPDANGAVAAINRVLFELHGFHGNREDYYDPRNSYLHDVLERRTGIPISLSVVYLEIARRLGLPVYGVGLPGHFIVKYDDGRRRIYVDPFHEGKTLNRQGCRSLLRRLQGRPVELRDEDFAAVGARYILLRMCHNLRGIFMSRRMFREALEAVDAIVALDPSARPQLKTRAWLHFELGQRARALEDLELYSKEAGEDAEREEVDQWIGNLRRTIAQMN